MNELFDEKAARVLLVIESGESIRQVAQHLHAPYETVRQAVNRLEDAGYLAYDTACSSPTIAFARRHATCWWRVPA